MEVVGKGEEDSEDKKGKANNGDREYVADSVLPEIVESLFQEVLYFLDD